MLSSLIAIVCTLCINTFAASNYYSTKATATTREIELSTSTLNKAKSNAKKYGNAFTSELCIENVFISSTDFETGVSWSMDMDNYVTYNSNIRVGVKYDKGNWKN